MKITIVGGLGVGMAHAIAANKLGYQVVNVIDLPKNLDECTKRYHGDFWVNKWGDLEEYTVAPKAKPLISAEIEVDSDLTIIATPNRTHKTWVHETRSPKVLCEKPLTFDLEDLLFLNQSRKYYVGYKTLCREEVRNEILKSDFMAQFHSHPDLEGWKSQIPALEDIGTHLVANVVWRCRDFDPNHYQVDVYRQEKDVSFFYLNHACLERPIAIFCGYNIENRGINHIQGHLVTGDVSDIDQIIGTRAFPWDEKVFEYQLQSIAEDAPYLMPFTGGWCVDQIIEKVKACRPVFER